MGKIASCRERVGWGMGGGGGWSILAVANAIEIYL